MKIQWARAILTLTDASQAFIYWQILIQSIQEKNGLDVANVIMSQNYSFRYDLDPSPTRRVPVRLFIGNHSKVHV